jgi:hypothetical protein
VPVPAEPAYNPAQQQVLDLLGARGEERPEFDAELRHQLRARLEAGLRAVEAALPADETLFLSKHKLAQVHGCEAKYLVEEEAGFQWSVPVARGTVVHKAVELLVNWRGDPQPLDLVDEALARLEHGEESISEWLQGTSETDRAELRARANDAVAKFLECFPPLKRQWRPVTESRTRLDLFDERITLSGRVDLSLGAAEGLRAGKVLIDLKTGRFSPHHFDDLRFYALVEAIRLGVPPRLLASYYLDSAELRPEPVTEGLLDAAVERTIAAAHRIVALRYHDHVPEKRVGPPCRWCPALADCAEGRTYLDSDQASADLTDWS